MAQNRTIRFGNHVNLYNAMGNVVEQLQAKGLRCEKLDTPDHPYPHQPPDHVANKEPSPHLRIHHKHQKHGTKKAPNPAEPGTLMESYRIFLNDEKIATISVEETGEKGNILLHTDSPKGHAISRIVGYTCAHFGGTSRDDIEI